ncbi:hypothetical protein [Spartinivicinus poritis]|uniref:Uncharacterized protein n=1 Tax=Spartinivicinus poritis TaxID=2994640 RepID=A0ABT5U300_9GAMM|nr:hypothetical protein [Spartinivicinus sp. A2-2]MDE1460748.1 hypothetical protein [Spartinivicinus sp. A2-2]
MNKMPVQLILLSLLASLHLGQTSMARDLVSSVSRSPIEYIYPSHKLYIHGTCKVNLNPDKALIVGGISTHSFNIVDASKQLDTIINDVQVMVEKQKGKYLPLERLRSVEQRKCKQPNCNEKDKLFHVMQRMELEFPIKTNVDNILEQLIEVGMNQFGRHYSLYSGSKQRQILVRYRFSDNQIQPTIIKNNCVKQSIDQWCADTGLPQGHRWCEAKERASYFQIQNISLKSQPVIQESGSSRAIQLYFSNGALVVPDIELMGNVNLLFKGSVKLKAWPNR